MVKYCKKRDSKVKRIVTSIRIDKEVFEKAKKIGLNVSKVAEKALKDIIERIEGGE